MARRVGCLSVTLPIGRLIQAAGTARKSYREGAGQKSGALTSKTAPENFLALIRRIFVHIRYFIYTTSRQSRWLSRNPLSLHERG